MICNLADAMVVIREDYAEIERLRGQVAKLEAENAALQAELDTRDKALEQAVKFLPEYGFVGTPNEPGKEFIAFGPKFAHDVPELAAYLKAKEQPQ